MARLTLLILLITTFAVGQGEAPSSTNRPGAQFPRIHPDRKVTFQLVAPNAKKVQLVPGGGDNGLGPEPYEMTRADEKGTWTVTTPPAVPGFHYYWFNVDGLTVNDPNTFTYFGWNRECSGVEIPDPSLDFYSIRTVPHGVVRIHWYFSKTTGAWRRAYVYTPPGYDETNSRTRYPVLYLQHGSGESERGWIEQGKANFILDNLLAGKKAKPMIIVMENGMVASKPEATPGPGSRGNEAFEELVIQDLIPAIDSAYRTRTDRVSRAIAGLSMGAGQALQIGLSHLDQFAYVGSFSGGLRNFDRETAFGGAFKEPAKLNARLHLLWMGAGTAELDRMTGLKQGVKSIQEAGVKLVWFQAPGTSHEWQTWRLSLYDFAPRLF